MERGAGVINKKLLLDIVIIGLFVIGIIDIWVIVWVADIYVAPLAIIGCVNITLSAILNYYKSKNYP